MTSLDTMTDCPTEETLAAFIDQRLDGAARATVIAHLAECGECRELVLTAGELEGEAVVLPSNVRTFTPRRKFIAGAIAAAAAAAILVLVAVPWWRSTHDPMKDLIAASGKLEYRNVSGRLTGFPHEPQKTVYRNGGPSKEEINAQTLAVAKAAAAIEEDVSGDDSPSAKHRLAIAYLVSANDSEHARELLSAALQQETGEADPAKAIARSTNASLLNDFSVAFVDRNAALALQAAERSSAIKPTAEAAWNRAVALQALDRDALSAWKAYRALDPNSPWSAEAQEKIDEIEHPSL